MGAPKQRAVLAVLLLARNQLVSRNNIIDAVWGPAAPPSAVNVVQTYIAGLRRALEPSRPRRAPAELLTSTGDGYLLHVQTGQLDLDVFEERVSTAARLRARGDLEDAARTLAEALRLWRGDSLGGVPGSFADAERARLAERRLAVVEERISVDLALGRGGELVSDLTALVAEHPLRERLHALFMRALWQAGRQAEALAAYRRARHVLVEELGVDPGAELQRLHQAILVGEPTPEDRLAIVDRRPSTPARADSSSGVAGGVWQGGRVPAQLPRDVAAFVGRTEELAGLHAMLAVDGVGAEPVGLVVGITGPAGVGKTALAVHWAHQVKEIFGDGQLYIDLHGYDPEREPVETGEVLRRFLRALGVPSSDVPQDLDERSALYRTLLANRRMIVLLDNVRSSLPLLPLLPDSSSCVLVTSRRRLDGLVAHADARLIELTELPQEVAVELVSRIAGPQRACEEPAALRRLTELCDGLPLALRVAAARLAAAPRQRIAALVDELDNEQDRLAALGLEDGESAVRVALDASRRVLPAEAARMLAVLGLHPGPDITPHLAATMAGVDLATGHRRLDALADAHLLASPQPGRYAPHDLVRLYARSLSAELPDDERDAAISRMLDYYLHCADRADQKLPIARGNVRIHIANHPTAVPGLEGSGEAMAWLESERANLLAAAAYAASHGRHTQAWQLPFTLVRFFWMHNDLDNWLTTHLAALASARLLDDPDAQFVTLHNIGVALDRSQRFDEALDYHRQALQVCRAQHNTERESRCLTAMGNILRDIGRHGESEEHYQLAVRVSSEAGSMFAEATARHNYALLQLAMVRYEQAATLLHQALRVCIELGDELLQALVLSDLAEVHLARGQEQRALQCCQQALRLADKAGSVYHLAQAHDRLGRIMARGGNLVAAKQQWHLALAMFSDINAREADEVRARLANAAG